MYHEKDHPEGDSVGELAFEEEALNKFDSDITRLRMRESRRLVLECTPVNSAFADHQSLSIVLDAISSQVLRLRQHVEVIKTQPADDAAGKH